MSEQITNTIMMIRPVAFHKNEETAVNNFYQQATEEGGVSEIQRQALAEFDGFVKKLRSNGINVMIFEDIMEQDTPDSIFPNNWNSFHEDGTIFLYPMFAENRRREVRNDILAQIKNQFEVKTIHSFTHWETKNHFLEGTGSLILDRENRVAYAALSERTQQDVLRDFSEKSGFELVEFTAYQTVNDKRLPIYHTNVMMCLGENFVLVCMDSVDDEAEKDKLLEMFRITGKEVITISEGQCNQFAGNMLQVKNSEGKRFIAMSESALQSLTSKQRDTLAVHGELLHHPLPTIEKYGGGSARCMMAEIFLQPKQEL